jgi:hypothetical protein
MAAIKKAREELEKALKMATMHTARFGPFDDGSTDYGIKRDTALWRESWVLTPIIEAIRLLDPCRAPHCWDGILRDPSSVRLHAKNCTSCKGWGIAKGLPFEPYKLSREATEQSRERMMNNQLTETLREAHEAAEAAREAGSIEPN